MKTYQEEIQERLTAKRKDVRALERDFNLAASRLAARLQKPRLPWTTEDSTLENEVKSLESRVKEGRKELEELAAKVGQASQTRMF